MVSLKVKTSAQKAVELAVRRGALAPIKTCKCVRCAAPAVHYHHASYERDQWLEVVPLCWRCHVREHTEMARAVVLGYIR